VAAERGFDLGQNGKVSRIVVRSQRSRWGSCSRRGTISLNAKLLFLPPGLVEYVFLHELCHTQRMDHSKAYWALLRRHVPDCKRHARTLRATPGLVPAWVDATRAGVG
jgi:predicted metal-dependent hydrolase